MLTRSLYDVSKTVLTNPVIVANTYILDTGNTPLGYLPVQRLLKLDLYRNDVELVQPDKDGLGPWYIIPYHYKYYEDRWHPALAVKRPRPTKDPNKRQPDRWSQHLSALRELESYLSSVSSPYAEHVSALLEKLQDENRVVELVTERLKSSGMDNKAVEDALYIPWLFLWNGIALSDLPEVVEWQREQFVLKGYAARLADFKLTVTYLNGKAHIHTPSTYTSMLTGEVVTDPCIYMVPSLAGGNMEQLISFDKDSFSSYGMQGNLNAPMGLEESWWVAAAASIVFQDNRFTAYLGDNIGITFLPKHARKIHSDLFGEAQELGIRIAFIDDDVATDPEDAERNDEDGGTTLDPDTRAAHRAAVQTARQFPTGSDRRPSVSPDAEVIAILREKAQGRSPIRYYSELPVGAPGDTSHSTARGRFHHMKNALRIADITGNVRIVSLMSIIQMLKKVYRSQKSRLPSDIYTELWRCSYDNTPYPPNLVQVVEHEALSWIAHDSHIEKGKSNRKVEPILVTFDNNHVIPAIAFLKAHLYFSGYEVSDKLDVKNKNTWYNLGRIIAICQWFQRQSLGNKRTNIEELLSSIHTQTNWVIFQVLQIVTPHIKKVERNRPGEHTALMTKLSYAISNISPEDVTSTTKPDYNQLALVMLGYYQQLTELFRSGENHNSSKEDNNHGEEQG